MPCCCDRCLMKSLTNWCSYRKEAPCLKGCPSLIQTSSTGESRTASSITSVYRRVSFNLTGNGEPERLAGSEVSAELFGALRAKPVIGRTFLEEEDKAGANPVVVLGYGL